MLRCKGLFVPQRAGSFHSLHLMLLVVLQILHRLLSVLTSRWEAANVRDS